MKSKTIYHFAHGRKKNLRLNYYTQFHQPTTVTLLQNGIEEHVDFSAKTFGYNFEIEHFNQLLRDHKKESDLMSFSFSKDLIATIDLIRKKINLNY